MRVAMPESAGVKGNFGHFQSLKQHANDCTWLGGMTSYRCSVVISGLCRTVFLWWAVKFGSAMVYKDEKMRKRERRKMKKKEHHGVSLELLSPLHMAKYCFIKFGRSDHCRNDFSVSIWQSFSSKAGHVNRRTHLHTGTTALIEPISILGIWAVVPVCRCVRLFTCPALELNDCQMDTEKSLRRWSLRSHYCTKRCVHRSSA